MSGPSYTHHDLQELLGAFALDAVDDDERDVIEAHLAGCPRCRAEVAGHRETAALLAHTGDRAPDGVWDRIAEALDEAPPVLDLDRIAPRRTARAAVPRSISLRVAATGVANAAGAALTDPRAEQVKLASTDGKATAQVVRLPDGTGYLVPTGLPTLPGGRVYQLWAVRSDARGPHLPPINISLGVLGAKPEVSAFRMAGPVIAYAVTDEAAGGVGSTQNQPVVVGYVKA